MHGLSGGCQVTSPDNSARLRIPFVSGGEVAALIPSSAFVTVYQKEVCVRVCVFVCVCVRVHVCVSAS